MSIASGNHLASTQQVSTTKQRVNSYSSHYEVSKEDQNEFESNLYGPNWDKDKERIFNKGLSDLGFRQANATSRHYSEEYKKTMDDLNDSGKSKSHHRQG